MGRVCALCCGEGWCLGHGPPGPRQGKRTEAGTSRRTFSQKLILLTGPVAGAVAGAVAGRYEVVVVEVIPRVAVPRAPPRLTLALVCRRVGVCSLLGDAVLAGWPVVIGESLLTADGFLEGAKHDRELLMRRGCVVGEAFDASSLLLRDVVSDGLAASGSTPGLIGGGRPAGGVATLLEAVGAGVGVAAEPVRCGAAGVRRRAGGLAVSDGRLWQLRQCRGLPHTCGGVAPWWRRIGYYRVLLRVSAVRRSAGTRPAPPAQSRPSTPPRTWRRASCTGTQEPHYGAHRLADVTPASRVLADMVSHRADLSAWVVRLPPGHALAMVVPSGAEAVELLVAVLFAALAGARRTGAVRGRLRAPAHGLRPARTPSRSAVRGLRRGVHQLVDGLLHLLAGQWSCISADRATLRWPASLARWPASLPAACRRST